ncbi:hypothetical protein Fmac_027401 [Flemingia macrophylla]|uniref:Clp R domain-containing protein n=1 Tax=Flemingia macrophylla TaxID=520843 RepID=A0ABD1LHK4_9FABA
MRTGSCGVQQGLTPEAASIVKQAVALAKRRGHAQVTPLHVANTMLSITNGLLRTACLQSHSHPLQCKALELCFNVALNRLPASTSSSPMLQGSHHHHSHSCPSISNALVAAFKRAQAHQRRGSIENQQQPLLAVKIELEQLIISILDDPSVSRVMREAGFSSPQVKSNVEQAVSLEICSQNNGNDNKAKENDSGVEKRMVLDAIRGEDVASVIDNLGSERKRSVVIVGECVTSLEGVVRGVMEKVDKGDVGECLRGVKFISLSLSSFASVSRVEVEQKVEELRGLVKASEHSKGYVLYLGDLKWVFDYRVRRSQGRACYCPVDHMVVEIGKMVSGVEENGGRFWVMGVATFQAYMRCKNGQPSLETLWGLHPITIPAGSLRLSLITESGLQHQPTNQKADNRTSWLLLEGVGDDHKQRPCFAEPSTKNETEVRSLQSSTCNSDYSSPTLPAWLQQYKNENKGITTYNDQNCVPVGELCEKWNSMCSSIQKQPYPSDKTLTLYSVSPSSSTSGFSYEQQHPNFHQTHHEWHVAEPKDSLSNHHFWISNNNVCNPNEPTLRVYIPEINGTTKQPFSSPNQSSNPNSASSSDVMEVDHVSKFKELSSENLRALCNALEKKVPWQKDIIPAIATTVLQCRSGKVRRKGKVRNSDAKEETWLFFQGVDVEAKEKIARELARLVFGSHNDVVSISLSCFATTRADSTEDCSRNKRSREEASCSYIERFAEAVSNNPHRVFLVEDIEQADYCSQLGFKRAIGRGRVADSNGEEVSLCDAIIILSCESFSSRSRACSPSVKQKSLTEEEKNDDNVAALEETSPCVSLDLNISIDDEDEVDDRSVDEIGLLESVDRNIIFNYQEL